MTEDQLMEQCFNRLKSRPLEEILKMSKKELDKQTAHGLGYTEEQVLEAHMALRRRQGRTA